MTHAAVTRSSSLALVENFTTSGYQGFADSRTAALGLMMRSAIWERACCACRGCSVSAKYAAMSMSVRGRLNVVMYQSRNGIRTNAKVRTRMATSHFLAIADLGGAGVSPAVCGTVLINYCG